MFFFFQNRQKKVFQNAPLYMTKKKAELFNCFFAKQRSIINNFSELPSNNCKKTDKSFSTVTSTSDEIATLIQNLDSNKTHDHDINHSHVEFANCMN